MSRITEALQAHKQLIVDASVRLINDDDIDNMFISIIRKKGTEHMCYEFKFREFLDQNAIFQSVSASQLNSELSNRVRKRLPRTHILTVVNSRTMYSDYTYCMVEKPTTQNRED